jgi:hypothetical protein
VAFWLKIGLEGFFAGIKSVNPQTAFPQPSPQVNFTWGQHSGVFLANWYDHFFPPPAVQVGRRFSISGRTGVIYIYKKEY